MEAWNIYTRNSREVGHECITFIESDSYFPTSHVSTHLSPVEWRTNSKSRLANNFRLYRELTRAGYLHESRNSNCLQPRSTSSTFPHRRVTRTTNRTTEKIRPRDERIPSEKRSSIDKIIRVVDETSPFPVSREEVYMHEIGSASRSASTDKITARRKKGSWLTAIPSLVQQRTVRRTCMQKSNG